MTAHRTRRLITLLELAASRLGRDAALARASTAKPHGLGTIPTFRSD